MDDWVYRALERWPNVPALYGWLSLDRRGRWRIRNELIGRRKIIETISRNYGVDERGCWYFQNGPQRGYMRLERAPFIVQSVDSGAALQTHTEQRVERLEAVFLDEDGGLYLRTEHGPAALLDTDLDWALGKLFVQTNPISEREMAAALALPTGARTEITFAWNGNTIRVERLDNNAAPQQLGFVREPIDPKFVQA